ncbi:MAG: hypothetical protein AAFX87_29880, partial [Bacteroidota bacterium]
MFRKRKLIKVISMFFLLEMLFDLGHPLVSYALTSGPTAPEATSFEPVDTSDMVNLATGDFVYNIPLLEVPGPSGGYPLSLSYHGGIQPNQESSWVGMGWTLNPGSISRSVSGFPDDHDNVDGIARTFWDGGETRTVEVGVSLGVSGAVSVNAGLSISNDTHRGMGVGSFMGVEAGFNVIDNVGIKANATLGISPYGGPYQSMGVGIGISKTTQKGLSLGAQTGLSTNFDGNGIKSSSSASVGYRGTSLSATDQGITFSSMGASISTNYDGSATAIGFGGANFSLHNSKSGNVSTSSFGFTLPLPLIRLGYKYQRYWIDETEVTHTNGSLYYPTSNNDPDDYRYSSYDTYSLLDPNEEGGIIENSDAAKVLGGSFPDYDMYSVNAQGLSGNMRPYYYTGYLARQSKYNEDEGYYDVKHVPLGYNVKPAHFRFVGDFSNHIEFNDQSLNTTYGFSTTENSIAYGFLGEVEAGDGSIGYDAETNQLAGSRHVEYFTNSDIISGDSKILGFINTESNGFSRLDDSQIGGFKITNSSGVTYHFALPAYSYDEYQKTTNLNETVDAFNSVRKPMRYAYTWYLTAVTGPDYVDRNFDGLLDDGDWGYWINFKYDKWIDDFQWRNPPVGAHKDLDANFETYSYGKKQIYYLSEISSKTHRADFITSERLDGREVSNLNSGGFARFSILGDVDPDCEDACVGGCTDCQTDPDGQECDGCETSCREGCREFLGYGPRPLKKLDKIELVIKETESIVRAVEFDHNNTLMPETSNSFDVTAPETKLGKLTLAGLEFLGKNEASIIPELRFGYAKNPSYNKEAYDSWGFYKSDLDQTILETNENLAREVSDQSSLDVDAWSLTDIQTSLGATIKVQY